MCWKLASTQIAKRLCYNLALYNHKTFKTIFKGPVWRCFYYTNGLTICSRFLVAKLLYKSKYPSVCMCVCKYVCLSGLGGNVIFSASNWDIAPIYFCADSPYKWASILYKFCPSVCRSGYKKQKCKKKIKVAWFFLSWFPV